MKDKLIKFETAVLTREKGFNISTLYAYAVNDQTLCSNVHRIAWNTGEGFVAAPSQSLLQQWFREKHNIIVLAQEHKDHAADVNDPYEWYPYIRTSKVIINYNNFDHGSYELALEAGLQKGLELL